jgi:hypothetical protein
MFPPSHSSPFVEQTAENLTNSLAAHISQDQRVHALEAEVDALQELVCHLLEKNEYLRMRLQMS